MNQSLRSQWEVTAIVVLALCASATPRVADAQAAQTPVQTSSQNVPTKPAQNATTAKPPQPSGSGAGTAPASASAPLASKYQPTWLPDDKAIKTIPPRVPALPQADWGWNGVEEATWKGDGAKYPRQRWNWLDGTLLAQLCLKSTKPSLQSIVADTFQRSFEPKEFHRLDVLAVRHVIERSPEVSYTELTESQLDQQLLQMGSGASGLKAKGFESIRWTMPGNELIYGVRAKDACVMQIKAQAPVRPSFQLLLEFSGVSSANYVSGKKLISEKHNVWPSRFAWADSINLRVVEAHANADEFRGVYIMKGSFGVDDERISRLDVYQGKGIARIVMQPASLADVQRLGMDSVQSAFPPSQSVEREFVRHYTVLPNGSRDAAAQGRYDNYFKTPNAITQRHWANRYGSNALKKRLPETMYGAEGDAVTLRSEDRSVALAIIPKKYWLPTYVELFGSEIYLSFDLSKGTDRPIRYFMSVRLLPPKAGEGLAKGVGEYLYDSQLDGGKKSSLLIRFVTAPALPDAIVDVYSEAIKLTDKETAVLAAQLDAAAKKAPKNAKIQ